MDQELRTQVTEYLNLIPVPDYVSDMTTDDVQKAIFQASEEIGDEYPQITQTPRMVALQLLYNAEAEEEGTGMMRRQNIKDYTVKDVKVVLDRQMLSPQVVGIISNLPEMQSKQASGRVGALV